MERDAMTGMMQLGRLVDVLAFGPFLVWLGFQAGLPSWARALLLTGGAMTAVSNLRNYLLVESVRRGFEPADALLEMGRL